MPLVTVMFVAIMLLVPRAAMTGMLVMMYLPTAGWADHLCYFSPAGQ
jgi:hypothetical protein